MKLLDIKVVTLTEKAKHKPKHHKKGAKVKHKKTGETGFVSGQHFIGGGYGWYPVTSGRVETSWHDNDTEAGESAESEADEGSDSDGGSGDSGDAS